MNIAQRQREAKIRKLLKNKKLSWDGPIPMKELDEVSAIADPFTIILGRKPLSFNPALAVFAEIAGTSYGTAGTSAELSEQVTVGECFFIHHWA